MVDRQIDFDNLKWQNNKDIKKVMKNDGNSLL